LTYDHYPFGMLVPQRNYQSPEYRYGFQGQEKDDEVKGSGMQYDYGFRIYDPRLGKFLSEDPLFKSFPWYTPYQFAGNKPIQSIDLDGLEELDYRQGTLENGNVLISLTVDNDVHFNSNDGKLIFHNLDTGTKNSGFKELNDFFNNYTIRSGRVGLNVSSIAASTGSYSIGIARQRIDFSKVVGMETTETVDNKINGEVDFTKIYLEFQPREKAQPLTGITKPLKRLVVSLGSFIYEIPKKIKKIKFSDTGFNLGEKISFYSMKWDSDPTETKDGLIPTSHLNVSKSKNVLGKLLSTLKSKPSLKLEIVTETNSNRTYRLRIRSLVQYLKKQGVSEDRIKVTEVNTSKNYQYVKITK